MEWKLKSYEELSKEELYRIIKLRIDVFIVEQNCPYHELDHLDERAHHLFLSQEGEIAAYCRLFPSGTAYPEASIGRVIVRKEDRGKGYAQTLLDQALRFWKTSGGEKGQDQRPESFAFLLRLLRI